MVSYFPIFRRTHLFIEEDVNKRVVDCGGFGEAGGYGGQSQVKWLPSVVYNPKSKGGIRHPTHQEAQHHDNHHPGHLLLCLLGGGRLSLSLCCLLREKHRTP